MNFRGSACYVALFVLAGFLCGHAETVSAQQYRFVAFDGFAALVIDDVAGNFYFTGAEFKGQSDIGGRFQYCSDKLYKCINVGQQIFAVPCDEKISDSWEFMDSKYEVVSKITNKTRIVYNIVVNTPGLDPYLFSYSVEDGIEAVTMSYSSVRHQGATYFATGNARLLRAGS